MKERKKEKGENKKSVYIKKDKKKKNKVLQLSRCIRSLKKIQDQDPYSSFQPCAIR
jgi:hypothetical protein